MSPERAGSPCGMEPRELALALQSVVPPFQLVRMQLPSHQAPVTPEKLPPQTSQEQQDDDLTSLTWLQNNNLLKGMNLTCVKAESETEQSMTVSQADRTNPPNTPAATNQSFDADQSPTSDYMDESSVSEPTDSSSSSLNSPVPYSYTPTTTPSKFNKHPHNVKYDPMVHTCSKPPYSFSSLIFMAIEDSVFKALPVKDIYAWILDHFPYFKNAPTGWKNSVRHNLSLNKCFQKVEKSPNLGKGSLWMVDPQYRPNLLQTLTRSPFHPCSTLDPATFRSSSNSTPNSFVQISDTKTSTRLPNPELFPYLSRRLAASEAEKIDIKIEARSDDESSLDDVDAATAILALKHGPRMLHIDPKRKLFQLKEDVVSTNMVQVITRSASEDHTYSSTTNSSGEQDRKPRASSPDEAFESDDSMHSRTNSASIDLEEQRRIEEGADALLNLAGISTIRTRTTHFSYERNNEHISPKRKRNSFSTQQNNSDYEPNEEYVKEQKFRPRMLRAKRKLDVVTQTHQSKRHIVNNNNNIIDSKITAKLISTKETARVGHKYRDEKSSISRR